MASVKTALVIGGGIGGPVAALALRKAGIDATIHEAYDEPAGGTGGALMIAPNGLAALRIVGVDAALAAAGQPIRTQVFAHGTGRRFGTVPVLPGMEPSLVVRRGDLCRILHDEARSRGIPTEFGKRLVGVDEQPDGIVARFADGTSARADILIGADGIHSTVRTLIDPAAPVPQHTGLISFGSPAPEAATPAWAKCDEMYFVQGRKAFFGYWRLPDGRTMWFSNLPYERHLTSAQARAVAAGQWRRQLREAYAGDLPAERVIGLSDPDDLIVLGSMEAMPPVPHWYRGRMVLTGDAVHAPSSSSGQGVSLTVESAVELARCLRDLPGLPAAFAAYEGLRRERVESIAATAARTNSQKSGGPVARALTRLLAPIFLKTFLTPEKMFGPVHRHRIDWNRTVSAPADHSASVPPAPPG
ncbi:NAD(P)/FAD-dependent oxidoreductase [Actinoplanes sp. L3-i22]|uniref:FAD-dependent oxidoreductase n=1 Tax=Actinoplanes sp. L3-i22 TaxID=2836373 RepID=UPI001C78FDC1|nr:FAD-dependent monooxygenase [Actinoplanes sp. L3-i22]BCY12022.1 FAD-dependent oxidoreductase [Actinoplanes sp. L3-i22]